MSDSFYKQAYQIIHTELEQEKAAIEKEIDKTKFHLIKSQINSGLFDIGNYEYELSLFKDQIEDMRKKLFNVEEQIQKLEAVYGYMQDDAFAALDSEFDKELKKN